MFSFIHCMLLFQVVKITGIKNMGRTMTVLVRGSNQLVRLDWEFVFP